MLCADQLKTSTSTLPPPPFPTPEQTPRIWTFEDWIVPYCIHSIVWQRRITLPKFLWQFSYQKRKKIHFANFHISSFQLFHLVQTRVFTAVSDLGARKKKKHIWNLTIPAQFSTLDLGKGQIRLPQEGLARQLSHSPDWSFVEVSIWYCRVKVHWMTFH